MTTENLVLTSAFPAFYNVLSSTCHSRESILSTRFGFFSSTRKRHKAVAVKRPGRGLFTAALPTNRLAETRDEWADGEWERLCLKWNKEWAVRGKRENREEEEEEKKKEAACSHSVGAEQREIFFSFFLAVATAGIVQVLSRWWEQRHRFLPLPSLAVFLFLCVK